MLVDLYRLSKNIYGVHGLLLLNGHPLCLTLERDWLENQRNISCIPSGRYECSKFYGVKFKDVWQLHNVPSRASILIHAGNSIIDSKGCILVGMGLNKAGLITESQRALDILRLILDDEFTLHIQNFTKENF